MKKSETYADIMLVLVAIIWGCGFIGVEIALGANMSAFLIMAFRFNIAAIVLLVVTYKKIKNIKKSEWIKGSIAGVFLFTGFYLQTIGQNLTTVSNSAFITATYVIMVPFIAWVIAKQKPSRKTVVLAFVVLVGVGVLTISPSQGFKLNIGDLFILLSAMAFACHVAYVELAVSSSSPQIITFIQISVAGLLSLIGLFIFDASAITVANYRVGLPAVLFLGLFSTCLCFFMQTSAQKRTSAAKVGIILSTEGFFGTLFSIVLGLEPLTLKIIVGGIIIITAVILTEVKIVSKKALLNESI